MKVWLIQSYFIFFSLFFNKTTCALTQSTSCPHDQSLALTQFCNSFSFFCAWTGGSTAKAMSWKEGTNCCLWDGINCDAETGNVIGLDLSWSCLVGPIPSNSTLFLLRHLRRLNLAYNDFSMSPIASRFGELTSLTHLNISLSGFAGKIPPEFSHLSKLVSLDLSYNPYLMFEGHVFGNLTQLRHLILSYVNMSLVEPASFLNMSSYITTLIIGDDGLHGMFPEDVFRFPYLEAFCCSSSHLKIKFPNTNWSSPLKSLQVKNSYVQQLPDSIGNLRSLEVLDLSYSNLRGSIPANTVGNLTNLVHLSLSLNNLSGLLPVSALNLPQVQFVDLSGNELVGPLPCRVSGLSQLAELYLDDNFLSGRVPSWLFSLPSLAVLSLHNNRLTGFLDRFDKVAPLKSVDLSNNEIDGPIHASFFRLVNLTDLDLSWNNLSGSFELDNLSNLSTLESLDLSNKPLLSFTSVSNADYYLPRLFGLNLSYCNASEFPNFVRNLAGLTDLDLSYNRIHVIEADMFVKLKNLESLDLSHNKPLSLSNKNNLTLVLPYLYSLSLSSCNITEFSNFLTTQKGLADLDLSMNLLKVVEYSSWKNLIVLNLGSNLLEGPLLAPPPSTSILLISKNRLTGEIPSSICNLDKDTVLDLSHNNLSGAIPRCLGMRNIVVLDLQMNHFHGNIPDFCVKGSHGLQTLSLNNNEFDGPLPKSLANCFDLEVLNLGNNKINDTFPHWLGILPRLRVLVLRSNYFHGQLIHSENGSHFLTLQILDLSRNEFSGFLPVTYFTSLKGMMNLAEVQMGYIGDDYGSNYRDSMVVTMKGVDFELERILTIFATLDMSSNKFEGTIPETVGNLVSLQVLNFSHNHLTGHIPSSLGKVAALESLDLSCNKLVGEIPSQESSCWAHSSGKQFNTFLNDSYTGNSGLCGFPVSKGCGHSVQPPATFDEQEADFDSTFEWDWKFVMMGYGCGMVFGFSAGYIMMTIRRPKWLVGMIQRAGNKVVRRFNKYR
ncbi:hypothetical protein GQ457_01G003540 [Hibiscus cannabinus]